MIVLGSVNLTVPDPGQEAGPAHPALVRGVARAGVALALLVGVLGDGEDLHRAGAVTHLALL
jgi:hypothetical protein